MGLFDKLKKESGESATAIPATPAIFNPDSGLPVAEIAIATPPNEGMEIPPKEDRPDPVTISERIGIKFEQEIPLPPIQFPGGTEDLGKAVFVYRGTPLTWSNDPPHVKVYAWCVTNLYPGRLLAIDVEPVARLLELTLAQVREAIIRLVKDGDLVMTKERGRELFMLNVQYKEIEP